MKITAYSIKQDSREVLHVFRVINEVPTEATVNWIDKIMMEVDGEQEEVEVPRQRVETLTAYGPDLYSFTDYIPADKYTVVLDLPSDPEIEFENQYAKVGDKDLPFRWDWYDDIINCYLPPHDTTATLIELYSIDGEKYDVQGGPFYSHKFWTVPDRQLTMEPGVQRQWYRTRVTFNYVRLPGSAWQPWSSVRKFYVRITNVKPILSNVLLTQLLVSDGAYESTSYGTMVERQN